MSLVGASFGVVGCSLLDVSEGVLYIPISLLSIPAVLFKNAVSATRTSGVKLMLRYEITRNLQVASSNEQRH